MRIVNDGERGSSIIDSVRAMLKKGDRKRSPLDLNELIYDVMQLAKSVSKARGVDSIRVGHDLPSILADRSSCSRSSSTCS